MKTDVIALDSLVADATEKAKKPDGSVEKDDVIAAIDAAHSIDLRVDTELTDAEVAAVAEAALAEYSLLMVERECEPHVVHQANAYETYEEKVASDADETDPRPKNAKVTGRRYIGLEDCPDCTRGLVSRGSDLVCVQVPPRTKVAGTQPGDIVCCGRPRA